MMIWMKAESHPIEDPKIYEIQIWLFLAWPWQRMETTLREKANPSHSTLHLYRVEFVQLEVEATRTQLSGSILAAAGLGCLSRRGTWSRTSDTTKRIQLFNTAPKIFCAYSIHPLKDRLNRGISKVDSITRK